MKINTTNLETNLKALSGLDFEAAEKAERVSGNTQPLIQFSSGFLARLAARALNVNPHEIKALPLNEYVDITGRVSNVLFTTSDENTTETGENAPSLPSEKSENKQ